MSPDELIAALTAIVGPGHLTTSALEQAPYTTDWRGRYRGTPLCLVRPASTDEVAQVVRRCVDARVPLVPQGGNTGLCGGATPMGGEVLVNLGRLDRVRQIDPLNSTITVEAGCILQNVQTAAESVDRLFPLSLAAEGSATIGGNLSTNAGGVQVLRYGNARELTLGLEVVLPNGEIWNGLRGLRKDNTGYDLKHLFIGAEGTLGLITAATLKLVPRPRHQATAWVAVADPTAAIHMLAHLRGCLGELITAFELISAQSLALVLQHIPGSRPVFDENYPWQILIELSGMEPIEQRLIDTLQNSIAGGSVLDVVVAGNLAQARSLWTLRENISEAQKREGVSIKHDISVPVSRIPDFIARSDRALADAFPGLRVVCFGHVGDGNLHYNVSKPEAQENAPFIAQTPAVNRIVHDIVGDLCGSISAEHGLGQLKRNEIARYKSSVELDLMRGIKASIDPLGLMNPGKLIPAK